MFGDIFDTKTMYTGLEIEFNKEKYIIIMSLKETEDRHYVLYTLKDDSEQIVHSGGFPKQIIKEAFDKLREESLKKFAKGK